MKRCFNPWLLTLSFCSIFLTFAYADNTSSSQNLPELGLWEQTKLGQEATECVLPLAKHTANIEPAALTEMCEFLKDTYSGTLITHRFTRNNQMVYCVDFDTQPAVRRELGKGNRIETPPSILEDAAKPYRSEDKEVKPFLVKGEKDTDGNEMFCPTGSVPYLFQTLETLTRFSSLKDYQTPRSKAFISQQKEANNPSATSPSSAGVNIHEYATLYSTNYNNWGQEAALNLWKPYTEYWDDFSLSQLWTLGYTEADYDDLQTIETGWQVYEKFYYDENAHFFVAYSSENYSDWCQNCGDFVQYSGSIYPGATISPTSTKGGSQYYIKLRIQKNGTDGGWWIRYGDSWVGYFPLSLFGSGPLKTQARRIDFGGEIYDYVSTVGTHTKTDMGSGSFPEKGYSYAAYQRNLKYLDTSGYSHDLTRNFVTYAPLPKCYNILAYTGSASWGTYFYFGGAGYSESNGCLEAP